METLPEDALIAVLVLVPARDLVRRCRLVCSLWRGLVDLPSLWRLKCQREGYWPEPLDSLIPDWRDFYFLCSLKRNLIKNPCAEDPRLKQIKAMMVDHQKIQTVANIQSRNYRFAQTEGLDAWEKESDGGNGWNIEQLPGDHGRDFHLPHVKKYFVTSYDSCMKRQMITLRDHGYWDQLMDEARPDIVVSDWYAARFDCGCQYELCVRLLSKDYIVLQELLLEPVVIEQWSDGEWRKVSHTFHNYPAGVRHVLFSHGGRDTQYWEGWYGVRVTNSSLTLGPQVAD